jgi:cysteine desulfurase
MQMLKRLEELGCYVKIAPLDKDGKVDLAALKELISPRTALITMSIANGLTGVIQPIEEIAALAKEKNVLLHLDATYAVGKTYFSFSEIGADYLTFAGDRIHSVKSSGALFAKKGAPISSFIMKGAGIDAPSLMALSAAASQAALYLDRVGLETARLRDLLESKIQNGKPLFKDSLRLPNTTTLIFPGAHQEALLYLLNRKGVFASIGGPYAQHLSRILIASGIDSQDAESAISFSLSRMTTEEEIIKAAAIISECAHLLQIVSEDLFCKQ